MLRKGTVQGQFGEALIKRRAVSRDELSTGLERQQGGDDRRIGEVLVDLGYLDADDLSKAVAHLCGVEAYSGQKPAANAIALVPREFAESQLVLPVALAGETLTIATPEPDDAELIGFIGDRSGKQIRPLAAASAIVREQIAQNYHTLSAVDSQVQAYETTARPAIETESTDLAAVTEDAPVVRIVNILITEGLRGRASDIHIEPQAQRVRVRYRVDGALRDVKNLPATLAPAIASRIKVMSQLDIVERHRSQDGQIALQIDGRDVDIRVSTTETIWGEKIVLRLLDRTRSVLSVSDLGMPNEVSDRFLQIVHVPFGMNVVAGPTGSGKTTTLYASLNELDFHEQNITTIEDPVEYVFPDINQIQIRPAAGRTFADGLRAILRQDPDVILVGEVRDRETAEIATQAALTGHTVFCSVHATDASAALGRFIDMGVESFLLAPAIESIVAQRLVRRICSNCPTEYTPTADERALFEKITGVERDTFWQGAGCPQCSGTGYFDRIGVFELLRVDDAITELIVGGATQNEIREAAVASGMVPLETAAMEKVKNSETTISEVVRTVYAG